MRWFILVILVAGCVTIEGNNSGDIDIGCNIEDFKLPTYHGQLPVK